MAAVRIQTDRLWLRPIAEADVDRLHTLFTLPGVRFYLLDDAVMPRSWVEEVVAASEASFAAGGWGLWCIASSADGDAIGFTGYREFRDPPVVELVYGLDPQHWGRGVAREASTAAVRHGIETLGFDPIRVSLDLPNEASFRLALRLGFEEVRRGQGLGNRYEQVHLELPADRFRPGAERFETTLAPATSP